MSYIFADPTAVSILDPRFGVPTNGTSDATAAFNAAKAVAGAGGKIILPSLPFALANWSPADQMVLEGAGTATVLKAFGTPARVVDLRGLKHCALRDFVIDAANVTIEGMTVGSNAAGTLASQRHEFKHLRIQSAPAGLSGVYVRDNGQPSNQADKNIWDTVTFQNNGIAFTLDCPNGQNQLFLNCDFSGNGKAFVAKGGTATLIGGQFQSSTTADISFEGANVQSFACRDVYFESTTATSGCIASDLGGGDHWPVRDLELRQCRVYGDVRVPANAVLDAAYCEFDASDIMLVGTDSTFRRRHCDLAGGAQVVQTGTNTHYIEESLTNPLKIGGSGNNLIEITADSGKQSELRMQGHGSTTTPALSLKTSTSSTSNATFTLGGNVNLRLYGTPGGSAGAAMALGVDDNSAIGGFAVGTSLANRKGLFARARTAGSQTGNLFEAQAPTSSDSYVNDGVYSGFTENGYPFTRKVTAPPDAELIANEVATWWDPSPLTGGLRWKGKDSAGTVLLPESTAPLFKTAAYTAAAVDRVILADAASGELIVTLPTAVGRAGKTYTIKKIDASVNAVMLDPNGSETIDGAATLSLANQHEVVSVVSDGTNWVIV